MRPPDPRRSAAGRRAGRARRGAVRLNAAAGHWSLDGGRVEYRWYRRRDDHRDDYRDDHRDDHCDDDLPTLVWLHEGLGCVAQWRDFPDGVAAATGLPALAYSRFGYGGSAPITPPRPLDYMQREAYDVLPQVLDHAGVARPLLIGHSDGATIALLYAARHPAAALVLLAPHVFCEPLSLRGIERARRAFLYGGLREALAKYHGANVDGAFWGWNRAWLDPRFATMNIESCLPSITAPILLLQGEDDQYGSVRQLDSIRERSGGGVTTCLLPDCGHAPQRERPRQSLDGIADFICQTLGRRRRDRRDSDVPA